MRIAIVEDEHAEAVALKKCIDRCVEENIAESYGNIEVTEFNDAVDFLTDYKSVYDIVFMDIEMPRMNGIRSAKKLREMDSDVSLVFVTRMAQYALNGYEVGALDYLLKPINYQRFSSMFKRLLRNKRLTANENVCHVKTQYGIKRIPLNRIAYIEITGHKILYHADETVQSWGTLNELEKNLPQNDFVRANSSFIVNLAFVTEVKGYELFLNDFSVMMSRNKKAEVLSKLAAFIGGK